MNRLILLVLLALALTGCQVVHDPLGATTRESIRASAELQAAQAEAEAIRLAAEAQADAEKHAATQETVRAGIWAGIVPVALLIVGAIVIGSIVVNWQGRIWHERAKTPPRPAGELGLVELRRLAARQGYRLEIDGAVAYLIDHDGERVARRLLT